MTLTKEQEKWLTEKFLGLCWHEKVSDGNDVWGPGYTPPICSCGKTISRMTISHVNLDFTDWRTFGLLKKKLLEHKDCEQFLNQLEEACTAIDPEEQRLDHWFFYPFLEPVPFALAIYEFFNGGNDERADDRN